MQLQFNKKEQQALLAAISEIGYILLQKRKEGVQNPTLEGNMKVEETNEMVVFEITVRPPIPASQIQIDQFFSTNQKQ